VGEIRDEFDREELLTIRKTADGGYRALARVSVRDFNRLTGWEIPGERGDTLGGVVFNALGHSPRMSEVVDLGPYRVEIIDVSGNRITEVKIDQRADGLHAGTSDDDAHGSLA
jgi:CBS domain containing-hemolysin-like protein